MEKRIEIVQRRVGDLKLDFGNPRKIKKQKPRIWKSLWRSTGISVKSSSMSRIRSSVETSASPSTRGRTRT